MTNASWLTRTGDPYRRRPDGLLMVDPLKGRCWLLIVPENGGFDATRPHAGPQVCAPAASQQGAAYARVPAQEMAFLL
jgi:hypothetical protein